MSTRSKLQHTTRDPPVEISVVSTIKNLEWSNEKSVKLTFNTNSQSSGFNKKNITAIGGKITNFKQVKKSDQSDILQFNSPNQLYIYTAIFTPTHVDGTKCSISIVNTNEQNIQPIPSAVAWTFTTKPASPALCSCDVGISAIAEIDITTSKTTAFNTTLDKILKKITTSRLCGAGNTYCPKTKKVQACSKTDESICNRTFLSIFCKKVEKTVCGAVSYVENNATLCEQITNDCKLANSLTKKFKFNISGNWSEFGTVGAGANVNSTSDGVNANFTAGAGVALLINSIVFDAEGVKITIHYPLGKSPIVIDCEVVVGTESYIDCALCKDIPTISINGTISGLKVSIGNLVWSLCVTDDKAVVNITGHAVISYTTTILDYDVNESFNGMLSWGIPIPY
jgi:hypothetical protein